MAGRGSRLRPHTLITPKPLVCVSGKPIVQHLVEEIVSVCNEKVDEIAFIIGDFGKEVEESLCNIALKLGAKPKIYYQKEPLGTAHAILCAKNSLRGNCVVAFADTLFKAKFKLDKSKDGIIWVSKIDDPSSFGVVQLDSNNNISAFVEKPEKFVSDLAIIGIYYAKYEGLNTLKSGFTQLSKNETPAYEVISGAAIAFAALLLIIPGFATDALGFLLIFPYSRKMIFKKFSKKFKPKENKKNNFIDGDFEDIEDDNDRKI